MAHVGRQRALCAAAAASGYRSVGLSTPAPAPTRKFGPPPKEVLTLIRLVLAPGQLDQADKTFKPKALVDISAEFRRLQQTPAHGAALLELVALSYHLQDEGYPAGAKALEALAMTSGALLKPARSKSWAAKR